MLWLCLRCSPLRLRFLKILNSQAIHPSAFLGTQFSLTSLVIPSPQQSGVLRVLDLSCCSINDDTLLLLKDHSHLIESLNLSYCAQITGAMEYPSLFPLRLSLSLPVFSNRIGWEKDFCLPQLFRKQLDGKENRLQKCDLSYTLIGQFTVNALLGCCPHLHSLTLGAHQAYLVGFLLIFFFFFFFFPFFCFLY